ncbi:MAG TPA: Franean1_4349 family RiPP [Herpetosiphonaceae bacterium]
MDIQTLVGKAVSDPAFAQRLVDQPEAALREAGIEPTPDMVDALKSIDVESLQALAAAFGEGRAAV